MIRSLALLASHALVLALGVALGIYLLPILTATPGPDAATRAAAAAAASFRGEFRRELAGSDALHWGEGVLHLGPDAITHDGRLAPGPDYALYLSPVFVEDEAQFEAARTRMLRVGEVRGFDGFRLPLPAGTRLEDYSTAVVWCEAFGEFISAARYRD